MSLSRLRIEDISLLNYIKYEVLGYHFIERLVNQSLQYNSDLDLYVPDFSRIVPVPNSIGRGFVPFDESSGHINIGVEQTSRISVIGATTYRINYPLCGVETNETPTSISYYWNYVSVLDSWPSEEPPPLPIVSIDIDGTLKRGYQLGGGHTNERRANIHIFATSDAERKDLIEIIYDALYNKSIKVTDYSQGDYLDGDGFYDSSFTAPSIVGVSNIYFDNITTRNISFPTDWSDINKYRAVINFLMTSYIN